MEKGVAMTPDIKERLSELIGEMPPTDINYGTILNITNCSNGYLSTANSSGNYYYSTGLMKRWRAQLIERLAKDASILSGHIFDGKHFCKDWIIADSDDDHTKLNATCLALDFQPIKRGVSKDEIINCLRNEGNLKAQDELADRIEREGIV